MHLQSFDIEKELDVVNGWMQARDLYSVSRETLPEIGFIAYENSLPIGVAFLRQCEGGFCMGDMIITNPDAEPKYRDKALNLLFGECLRVAKARGFKAILAYSLDDKTIERLEKHGLKKSPFTYLTITF